jgi:hypothetical protein
MRQRYSEHQRYIKNNEPKSAYALHILNETTPNIQKGKEDEHPRKLPHAETPTRRYPYTGTKHG